MLAQIDRMEGHEFEYWCAWVLSHNGFNNVEVTLLSGDQGVDVIAYRHGKKYAIQCKRYKSALGNKPV
ncbi:MAG: restriction endonuclease, partial [bacterium]